MTDENGNDKSIKYDAENCADDIFRLQSCNQISNYAHARTETKKQKKSRFGGMKVENYYFELFFFIIYGWYIIWNRNVCTLHREKKEDR